MRTTTKMTVAEMQARIAVLEKTDRVLVGTDEGTHRMPLTHRIYEDITGHRYATAKFGGSNATRCTERSAVEDTEGRIIYFSNATAGIRELRAELIALRKAIAKA